MKVTNNKATLDESFIIDININQKCMGNFPIDMSPVSFEWGVFVWLEQHPLAHDTLGATYHQEAL